MTDRKDRPSSHPAKGDDQVKTPPPAAQPAAGKSGAKELADDELKSVSGGRSQDDFALKH